MLPRKLFKIRIFHLAENEFQITKFPDFQGSLSNSLTFPGFPGQWQPCKAVTFQQFFNWFCFVPLWFSLSHGFASWEGSLALAFYGQNRLIKCGWCAFRFKWIGIQMSALELGHCRCANNEIFVKKSIQSIFLKNKCKLSEKQLEKKNN